MNLPPFEEPGLNSESLIQLGRQFLELKKRTHRILHAYYQEESERSHAHFLEAKKVLGEDQARALFYESYRAFHDLMNQYAPGKVDIRNRAQNKGGIPVTLYGASGIYSPSNVEPGREGVLAR